MAACGRFRPRSRSRSRLLVLVRLVLPFPFSISGFSRFSRDLALAQRLEQVGLDAIQRVVDAADEAHGSNAGPMEAAEDAEKMDVGERGTLLSLTAQIDTHGSFRVTPAV